MHTFAYTIRASGGGHGVYLCLHPPVLPEATVKTQLFVVVIILLALA